MQDHDIADKAVRQCSDYSHKARHPSGGEEKKERPLACLSRVNILVWALALTALPHPTSF